METGALDSEPTDSKTENDYFSATALSRSQARDEAIDVLKLVTEDEEASADAKAEAAAKISKIAVDIQNETNIETLVKAKGFEDCVAIISDDAALRKKIKEKLFAEGLIRSEAATEEDTVYRLYYDYEEPLRKIPWQPKFRVVCLPSIIFP